MEYKFIIIPLLSIVFAQIIKFIYETIKFGRIRFTRLFNGSGGFPSTHSSFVSTITTCIGLEVGFDSPLFALSLIMSMVICYDAIGVRWETGMQANTINRLVGILDLHKGLKDEMDEFKKLKEEVGHKPLEVLAGALLGIATSLLFF